MFVADFAPGFCQRGAVLSHAEIIDQLLLLKEQGKTSNAELARLIGLPSSRIAEVFSGKRRVTVDEAKVLIDHFGIGETFSASALEPLLDALIPLIPTGRMTDRSRKALSESLAYGLALLGRSRANQATGDALAVAARAAAGRYRETVTAS